MARLGANIIRGINRSIDNERASMQQRFTDQVNHLRWAEGMAYRDRAFDENVRQFGMTHALREGAANRDQQRLDSDLLTADQMRRIRDAAENRATELFPITKRGAELGNVQTQTNINRLEQLMGQSSELFPITKRGAELGNQRTEQLINQGEEMFPLELGIKSLQSDYLRKQVDNFQPLGYESRLDTARRELIEAQTDQLGQITPYQQRYLDLYEKSLNNRSSGSSPYKDPTFNQQRDIATDENLLNMMGQYMRRHTGKGFPFGIDIDEPWERIPKQKMTPGHGKRAPQPVLDEEGNAVYVDDHRDSSRKALGDMGLQMVNMLEDEFNNNPVLAYNRLNSLINAFLFTEHGEEMMGKWRKNFRGMSDDYIIQQVKNAFLEGARQHPILESMFEQMREQNNIPSTPQQQLDTRLR